jgi:hypothetical protein
MAFVAGGLMVSAVAAEILFSAELTGLAEVPPTPSPGTGTALLSLNDAETEVTYHIEFSGLLGTETAAHFHNAPPGVAGPVIFGLPMGSPKDGVWAVGVAEVAALFAGEVYVNVHSDMFPGGELRGDISVLTTPTGNSAWGAVKALY